MGNPEVWPRYTGILELEIEIRLNCAIQQRGGFEKISAQTGIPIKQLRRYCLGGMMPSLRNFIRIASACDVSLDWLANNEDHYRVCRWRRKLARLKAVIQRHIGERSQVAP